MIIGLGQTGRSCIAYLESQGQGYHLLDSRSDVPNRDALQSELCRSMTFNGLDGDKAFHLKRLDDMAITSLIVSPGVRVKGDLFDAAKEMGLDILGDVDLFARVLNAEQPGAKVIGITGSNGKSTVTQLLYDLMSEAGLSVSVGGNIGIPALELLANKSDWYVLELSSFQLETTHNLRPEIGTVLNISEDHMDRYDSFEDYRDTKLELLSVSRHQVVDIDMLPDVVEAYDQVTCISMAQSISGSEVQWHSEQKMIEFKLTDSDYMLDMSRVKLPGLHNIRNIMTVMAIWSQLDTPWTEALSDYVYNWPGLAHRCAFVAEIDGIKFYNDSKATNVGATEAAIDGFAATTSSPIVLIAGGVGKDADFSVLSNTFKAYLRALILMGRDAEQILSQAGRDIKSRLVSDMKEAVNKAYAEAHQGDVVLLSPACASLDMYPNFEHRGNDFVHCVEALGIEQTTAEGMA